MAREIFDALAEDRGLAVRADSAGVAALRGEPMAPNAVAALREVGIHPSEHRARQLDKKMLGEHDLVLTMSPWHVAEIYRTYREEPEDKVHTLPEYAGSSVEEEVSDPYGSSYMAYRTSVRLLLEYTDSLIKRLYP